MAKIIQHRNNGSALTYARRYSLLLAYGLATEDDDGASLTKKKRTSEDVIQGMLQETISQALADSLKEAIRNKGYTKGYVNDILSGFHITRVEDIKVNDLPAIKKELEI